MSILGGFQEPVIFDVQVIADKAIAQFRAVDAELKNMEKSGAAGAAGINKMAAAGKIATGILLGVGAAAGLLGVMSVKAAMDAEKSYTRETVALKAAGLGQQANIDMAKAQAEANTHLGFTVDQTTQAFGTLITATGNYNDSQKLLNVSMDLARYKGIDLATAANVVARGTQGSAKAFKELGITLDTTIPKQAAINKAFDELQKKITGQNAAYLDTFSGKLSKMGAEAKLAEEKIGNYLIPILSSAIGFIADNAKAILELIAGITAVAVGYKIYTGLVVAFNVAQAVSGAILAANIALEERRAVAVAADTAAQLALHTAIQVGMADMYGLGVATGVMTGLEADATIATSALAVAEGEASIASRALAGAMAMVDIAMDANPIMAVVAAVALLAAAFIGLDKLLGDGKGQGYTGQAQDTGRSSLAGIQAKRAQDALDARAKALGISQDKYNPHSQTTSSANEQGNFNLSGVAAEDAAKARLAAEKKAAAAAKTLASQHKAKLIADNKAVTTIYADMNKVITADTDRRNAIQKTLQDTERSAYQSHTDSMFQMTRSFNDGLYVLNRDRGINEDKLRRSAQQAEEADITKFNFDITAQEEKNADAITKIKQAAADKTTAIIDASEKQRTADMQAAADKQAAIVQKSIDLLTGAFNQATALDIGQTFADSLLPPTASSKSLSNTLINQVKDGVTASVSWWGSAQASSDTGLTSLMTNLKAKLQAAQELAKDSSALAAKGFSQSFIQSVVGQGTTIGDQMSKAILNSSPDTINQLQDLYSQIQTVSETGVTQLATQMSTGAHLATTALTNEYAQVATDLKQLLATNSADLAISINANNAALDKSLADQMISNSDAVAAINKTLADSRLSQKQTLDNALADEATSYNARLEDMHTSLTNSTNDANETLKRALKAAQDQFSTDIADTTTTTMKSLDALQAKLKATADEIKKLAGVKAAVGVMANSPAAAYISDPSLLDQSGKTNPNQIIGENGKAGVNFNQQNYFSVPTDAAQASADAIRFGKQALGTLTYGKGN